MIVSNFNNSGGWAYKIPDPQKGSIGASGKRPYDFYAVTPQWNIYAESKFLNKGFSSFNFNRLEEQQVEHLTKIKEIRPEAYCDVVVGYWESRKLYKFLILDINTMLQIQKTGKNNISKKDVQKLDEAGWLIQVAKGSFDIGLWDQKEIKFAECQRILDF